MSKMSEYHSDLEAIKRVMEEPVLSAEDQMERRCDSIIRELDELLAFTANPETVDLVDKQYLAVGQMVARIQLVAGFLNARKPALRVVSRA